GNFFLFDYWCFLTTPNRISDDDLRSLIESIDGREMERNRKETNEAMGGYDFKSIQKYDTAVGKLSIGAFRKKDYTQGYGHSFLWDRLPFTDNA
ncbi:MAG: hypothetical protein NTV49_05560, partial [Kiritimatiellaeota bacterium]|nr:hypothetical protein [Kiritimatiellota bacterium]